MTPPADLSPPPATRDRLIRAAMRIAAEEGLAAATTAAIARDAGVAEGTLYRHFSSKDDLLIAAYRQMKQDVFLNAAAEADAGDPPPVRLKRTWRAIYDAYHSDPIAFAFSERFKESAMAEREGGEAAAAIQKMVADIRKAGVASGEFKKLPVDLLANLFLAPLNYMLKSEVKGRKWTGPELEAAADAVLAGWRAD